MAYGCFFGSTLALTWLRKSTNLRKGALVISFIHFFGQYSVYSNLDLVFDKLYPIYKGDINNRIR